MPEEQERALRELARFAVGLTPETVPPQVRKTAEERILDTVSVALGGADNPQNRNVARIYQTVYGDDGPCAVWGQGFHAPAPVAAFLNGMMGHTLEMDDVHTKSKLHAGTVILPAAWAAAEACCAKPSALIPAVVAAYEVACRIAMAFGVKAHRGAGWHSTSTAGIFGAACASGKLMGLGEEEMVNCLGLAGAQSFGTWAFLGDGASCKVLNPARAAMLGVESALLAKAGMTGPEHILTAPDGGILHMMSPQPEYGYLTRGLREVWEITTMDNKPYPCCRSTHGAIDATLSLMRDYKLTPEQVDHVDVYTYHIGNAQCGLTHSSREPRLSVEAKFSTPYCVAAALEFGKVTLEEFLPETILRPDLQELLRRVKVHDDEAYTAAYPGHWSSRVCISCTDGRTLSREVLDASGSEKSPLTRQQALEKAEHLLGTGCAQRSAALAKELLTLDEQSVLPDLSEWNHEKIQSPGEIHALV